MTEPKRKRDGDIRGDLVVWSVCLLFVSLTMYGVVYAARGIVEMFR